MSDAILLAALPEKPVGWTRHLIMHLNFGGGKGGATYSIRDEAGRTVEGIGYGYNSASREAGFFLTSSETPGFLTWPQLRAAYSQRTASPSS